ncbi:MAG: hypothetical protein KC613_13820 [Myxococcales bacterium]|nr:hypothetical protein [Myxococcales bacterium]
MSEVTVDDQPAAEATRAHAVLCHPQDVRNIGTAIRAAANHGLGGLHVVTFDDHDPEDLFHFSAGASDVIELSFHRDLDEALAPFAQVIGTSRRLRDELAAPCWPAAGLIERLSTEGPVAILFGNERTGLSVRELDRCSATVYIPTHERKPSLNLGHAVACIGYELARPRDPAAAGPPATAPESLRAPRKALEGFYGHVEAVSDELSYPPGRNPELFTRRIRRLLDRANPTAQELGMLAGIFSELRRLGRLAGEAGGPPAGEGPPAD